MRMTLRSAHAVSRGFSLIEVLVALVLLAVGALGVASVSSSAARLAVRGGMIERWTMQLTAVLDSLRAAPCATLAAGSVVSPAVSISWSATVTPRIAQLAVVAAPAPPATPLHVELLHPCE